MTWGFSEPFGFRQTQTRWKDLEFYVHDSWKVSPKLTVDIGVRWSLLFNYYADDDTITSFNPALFNPALGSDPCNGLVHRAGHQPLLGGGLPGRHRGPEPLAAGREERRDRAAPGLRL